MSDPQTPPKKRGCLFYGAIIFLSGICFVFLLLLYGVYRLNALIAKYTDTVPVTFPSVEISQADLDQLRTRVKAFGQAIDAHSNTPPLSLTSRDINALLQNTPEVKKQGLDHSFYFELNGDHIKSRISFPLDKLPHYPFIHTRGRFLNGDGEFLVSVTNSAASLTLLSLVVKNKPVPDAVVAMFQPGNFVQQANQNPTNVAYMSKFDSVIVTSNNLVITPKSQ